MEYTIQGHTYVYSSSIKQDVALRNSFINLTKQIFAIDFSNWYENGYWGDNFIPHVLADGEKVVANVSVNVMHTQFAGVKKRYLQLGGIMTHPDYRGRGLARWLIEQILTEWLLACDAVYLFANDSVLNFYPKFGFEKTCEYQHKMKIGKKPGAVRKLNMENAADRKLLWEKYALSNPFCAFPFQKNPGVLFFYCTQFMKNHVYYLKDFDAVVIAESQGEKLLCYDIYCFGGLQLQDILAVLVQEELQEVYLGFTPKDGGDFAVSPYKEEDTTLFVLSAKENLLKEHQLMFPLLSHT